MFAWLVLMCRSEIVCIVLFVLGFVYLVVVIELMGIGVVIGCCF